MGKNAIIWVDSIHPDDCITILEQTQELDYISIRFRSGRHQGIYKGASYKVFSSQTGKWYLYFTDAYFLIEISLDLNDIEAYSSKMRILNGKT